MRKLALNLDSLSVQSFATTPSAKASRGTVNGHLARTDDCYRVTQDAACGPYTTGGGPNPEPSAGGTCALSICVPLTVPNDN